MSYYEFNNSIIRNIGKEKKGFDPYAMNGGSVVAIAGEDFAVIGADTRLSVHLSICTRNQKKLFLLSEISVLGVTGCWSDALSLSRMVEARTQMYKHEHNKTMQTPALAQMLATMLYYKRFFPYYVMSILAGLDEEGRGCVFSYDPVGHCERSTFTCGGIAAPLLQPLLDNQLGLNNMQNPIQKTVSKEKAVSLLKDVFINATERNIYIGDSVQIVTIASNGISDENYALRRD